MPAEQMFQTGSPAGMLSQVSSRSFLTGGDSIIHDIWNLIEEFLQELPTIAWL